MTSSVNFKPILEKVKTAIKHFSALTTCAFAPANFDRSAIAACVPFVFAFLLDVKRSQQLRFDANYYVKGTVLRV